MILAEVPNLTIQIGRDNKRGEYLSGKTECTNRAALYLRVGER
ncbi:MAG: hypothetical protein VXY66_08545 [Pseudomonadota bacterium]|nr:hypothetical protein [Pseudomonadota bacterium]MEC8087725.1 hypothetical protein [Pseudomonadota bacterium]MEC8288190.1 hypothetical protein [Pseudomonadota bacterium]MEC8531979.1 hypothetical protein [Pseudomonadota bacterium]